jgi:hypothetical protein
MISSKRNSPIPSPCSLKKKETFQKNFGLFYTIWLDTPAMQSSPHPAEQNKMFANDEKLKC